MAATRPLSEILPKEMTELRVRPLFTLLLDVQPPINVGKTPGVDRRVGVITGGRFEGERLRGTLFPGGGSDWQSIRPGDGAWMINVRIVLKTDDGAIIGMPYTGIRHGPQGGARPHRPRRGGQGDRLLSAHLRDVRNRVGKIRLAQLTSSASASATGCRKGRSIRCSKFCRRPRPRRRRRWGDGRRPCPSADGRQLRRHIAAKPARLADARRAHYWKSADDRAKLAAKNGLG